LQPRPEAKLSQLAVTFAALLAAVPGWRPALAAEPSPDALTTATPAATQAPRVTALVRLDLHALAGLAVDRRGAVYAAGTLIAPGKTFDTFKPAHGGATDVFVGRYDPETGKAAWARSFGDVGEQEPRGIAVARDAIAVVGTFNSRIESGAVRLVGTGAYQAFLLGLSPADGAPRFGRGFDLGKDGALAAVGANPERDRIAVCGWASAAATDLVPGAKHGGGRDVVIAMYDASGKRLWARQIGGADPEDCSAIAVDANGDVFAAGRYGGALSFTGAPLPRPSGQYTRWLWIAKLDGRSGKALAQAGFGEGFTITQPAALAVDASGDVTLCGSLTQTLSFGGPTTPLGARGDLDAFVARLASTSTPAFAARWAVRLGGGSTDVCKGVAVSPAGDVLATGFFSIRADGAAELTSRGPMDAFWLALDGPTGATRSAVAIGDEQIQGGTAVAAARVGGDGAPYAVFGGTFQGQLEVGGHAIETGGPAVYLAFTR
jgi:hypothetical protein